VAIGTGRGPSTRDAEFACELGDGRCFSPRFSSRSGGVVAPGQSVEGRVAVCRTARLQWGDWWGRSRYARGVGVGFSVGGGVSGASAVTCSHVFASNEQCFKGMTGSGAGTQGGTVACQTEHSVKSCRYVCVASRSAVGK